MSNRPNTRSTARTSQRVAQARQVERGRPWLIPVVVAAVVVAGLLALVLARSSSTPTDDPTTHADPATISGSSLPKFNADAATDPAVGMAMPTFTGEDLDGRKITVGPTGKPRIVLYLAHWCPHCQAEVSTLIGPWLKVNGLPKDVDLQAVTTDLNEKLPNYPPGQWLKGEGWPVPTLVDPTNEVAEASGLAGFPYWVLVDAQNKVVKRMSGEVPLTQLQQELAALAAGSTTVPGTAGPSSPAG